VTGQQQLQYVSWALYVLIFLLVLVRAMRRPTPAHLDMVLFFGAATLLIVGGALPAVLGIAPPIWLNDATGALLMSLAYLQLRLVADFATVPALVMRASEIGLFASIVVIVFVPSPLSAEAALLLILYFVLVIGYDTVAFVRAAIGNRGVTRRRMQAVAAGSLCIGLVLVFAAATVATPALNWLWSELSALAGLASGMCYFIGFAPPTWLRRAWQEPELRAFLSRAASLPRLPDTISIVRQIEHGAAESVGAPGASVGLWDSDRQRLCFFYNAPPAGQAPAPIEGGSVTRVDDVWEVDPNEHPISGRAFLEQRALFVLDVERADPANVAMYHAYDARTALAAPITAGDKRLGVLTSFAPRAPFFANSDLELLQLLADQAAVILESRVLIDEATRVRAREEATRLKDDFLSSAAHDLKTPLTGLVTQVQLLRRRAERQPEAPVDRVGLDRMLEQTLRLRDLVLELLDVSRLEHGSLLGQRESADLGALVSILLARGDPDWGRVQFEGAQSVPVHIDVSRLEQVITNLVENALKYSPHGEPVQVRVWSEDASARLSVRDQGIGITAEDLPLIFQRFHRGRNVDDRRFAGIGLGLYIAQGIVEQHDGRIWAESAPNAGSTFHVALPVDARGQ